MDPISAIAAAQPGGTGASQALQQTAPGGAAFDAPRGTIVEAAEVSRSAAVAPSNPMAEGAGRIMGNIHSTVERLGREIDVVETSDPTPAEDAKAALIAESGDIAPGGPSAPGDASANGADSNLAMLSKSFDHALFMAMVNQVISGVGDSSRSLIRQA